MATLLRVTPHEPYAAERPACPPSPLRLRRLTLGLRQVDLALLAGISREQVIRLEAGGCEPRIHTALRLAGVLDCDVGDLFPTDDDRAANAVVEKERDEPAPHGE